VGIRPHFRGSGSKRRIQRLGALSAKFPPLWITPAVNALGVWANVHGLAFIATLKMLIMTRIGKNRLKILLGTGYLIIYEA
jgi:hypothetical protein